MLIVESEATIKSHQNNKVVCFETKEEDHSHSKKQVLPRIYAMKLLKLVKPELLQMNTTSTVIAITPQKLHFHDSGHVCNRLLLGFLWVPPRSNLENRS